MIRRRTRAAFVLTAATLAAATFAPPANAQRLSKITGGKLVSICSNARQKEICEAYVSGVADGIAGIEHQMDASQGKGFAGATCIPNDASVADLRNTIVSYIRARGDLSAKPAAVPSFEALHAAYACKAG